MLAEGRYEEIIRLVEENRTISVQELAGQLQTSESTIRRDLNILQQSGKIKKIYGGAAAIGAPAITRDDTVSTRQERNLEEKRRIAQAAAEMIEPDDFVFIDAGTTTALLAEYVADNGAVFVTNAVFHAGILARKGIKCYIIGGEFKSVTEALVGGKALADLETYSFTKGFFGTNGISFTAGCSTPDVEEAMVKAKAIERCQTSYVLADQSKFGQVSSATFVSYDAVQILTTALEDPAFESLPGLMEVDRI